jgi:hypothetical protein
MKTAQAYRPSSFRTMTSDPAASVRKTELLFCGRSRMKENGKPWYLSKGFVGPLVTSILFGLRSLGIVDVDTDTALGLLYQVVEFVGLITGMVGRALARDKLTLGLESSERTSKRPD